MSALSTHHLARCLNQHLPWHIGVSWAILTLLMWCSIWTLLQLINCDCTWRWPMPFRPIWRPFWIEALDKSVGGASPWAAIISCNIMQLRTDSNLCAPSFKGFEQQPSVQCCCSAFLLEFRPYRNRTHELTYFCSCAVHCPSRVIV